MSRHTRYIISKTEYRALLTGFYILLTTLALVVVSLFTVGYLFSGVNPNSPELSSHFTSEIPHGAAEGADYVSQGEQIKAVYQVGENTFTASACTIAATGFDQNGDTVILTARHCVRDDEARNLDRIEIGSWSGDFEILPPEGDEDYVFIRVHGPLGTGGSQSIQRDNPIGVSSVCRQGHVEQRSVVCGRAWVWDGEYLSTADCHFGDSGGPLTSTDRSELVGVVSKFFSPRPGIRMCRSVPTSTIIDDVESGRVAGLSSFTLVGS